MRLTSFTDYSLRVLIFAAGHPDDRVTVQETATFFRISPGHAKKVVLTLTHAGFLNSMKGRKGGFRLALSPEEINLGDVILATEPDFGLFECFLPANTCRISRPCGLPNIANDALAAFLEVFRKYTLADVLISPQYFALAPVSATQPSRGPVLPRPTTAARVRRGR